MKRIVFYLLFISGAILAISCRGHKSKKGLMPELKNTDSAAVMYYDTANNPRFFEYTKVRDMKIMTPLFRDANKKVIPAREDCATQGKIYFYGKGEAVYLVYFSDIEGCMTLSFIITGEKYYTRMSSEVRELLREWQKMAKEPVSSN